ncbi:NUDIX hydrolase [Desulfoscipio geothermicus]|uniref:NUDIX domain-containing protein n=1 Tax=Desulfoscipio geothermicus DSM 3669 TaxID=1121426 RepID=A0A1I6D4A0_9FIRM|nr:CoA pyrophosphatase [Desulfoscipio geothermicus]SFR00318.1 NUDIX domain-containing protein [Desulfoscipio geothermicus DSM 3669]
MQKLLRRNAELMGKENFLISAVLIPLIEGNEGTEILFEVRSMHLDRQPGEICFPGGRVEPCEMGNPETAAVRETMEELSLWPGDIDVLGPLDFLVTPMGVVVYPYAGYILQPGHIEPNREEVHSVFTVPLPYLLANPPKASNVEVATRYGEDFPLHRVPEIYRGGWVKRWSFPTYIYEYKEYFIWGMTAIILQNFLRLILSNDIRDIFIRG